MAEEVAAPATTTPPVAAPVADAFVPLPKFKNMEEQARAYPELEKVLGKKTPPTTAPQIPIPPAIPDLPDEAGISAIVERTGLKEADIVAAWQEKGDLTAEQYAAFKKQGIPKGAVKEYLTAQSIVGKQMVEGALKDARDFVGGEKQHTNLLAWAGAGGIPKTEVDKMNAELAADPRNIVDITKRLYAEHTRAVGAGKSQPLIDTGGTAQGSVAYKSGAESAAVVNSKAYRDNAPGVREAHQKRIALTPASVLSRW